MWYFIAGAVLAVAITILRRPMFVAQSEHPIQGLVFVAVLGAIIFGTIFWLVGGLIQ